MWLIWVHDYIVHDKLQNDAHIWPGPDIAHIPLLALILWTRPYTLEWMDILLSEEIGPIWVLYGHANMD